MMLLAGRQSIERSQKTYDKANHKLQLTYSTNTLHDNCQRSRSEGLTPLEPLSTA